MNPLYTQKEFDQAKSDDKLKCQCQQCKSPFYAKKKDIKRGMKDKQRAVKFCSRKCRSEADKTGINCKCKNCGKEFYKTLNQYKRTKNHFCSQSCAATYNNKNKKHGNRRSKLEQWIEKALKENYPELLILPNNKEVIGSELDFYIPYLNLAIEINGIFHYEPIYGEEKLKQIQENDLEKKQLCLEKNIDLQIINTKDHSYITKKTSWIYIKNVFDIIDRKICGV